MGEVKMHKTGKQSAWTFGMAERKAVRGFRAAGQTEASRKGDCRANVYFRIEDRLNGSKTAGPP